MRAIFKIAEHHVPFPQEGLWVGVVLLLFCQLSTAHCPLSTEHRSTRSLLFGVGRARQYDTYLSPLEYKGPGATLFLDTWRPLKRQPCIAFQTVTQTDYSQTKNPAHTAHDIAADLRFDAGWHYNWTHLLPDLCLSAGGLVGTDVGFLYNNRNSNNPAQARASVRLSASVAGSYNLHIKRRQLILRYQADMPLVGAMFSPQYGQSYYNLFGQGNYDHNILLTHPGNALSLRQALTLSIPVRSNKFTLGYLSDLRQAKPHHLRQHQYMRSFMIGYVRELRK